VDSRIFVAFVVYAYFYVSVPIYFIAAANLMLYFKVEQDIKLLLVVGNLKEREHDAA
jgi:hypothetical protein